jgi:peptide-methionine (S)-S-oxide reductase
MNRLTAMGWPRRIAAVTILFAAAAGSVAAAPQGSETAVLAGGCFWGVEAVFERLEGVLEVTSGYAGGEQKTARYEMVGTGRTGHAESVQIVFDPARISYDTLLRVFFTVAHDPTELNYQGPDVGPQYRSAIFYSGDEQRRVAAAAIDALGRAGVYKAPIVTEVRQLEAFYPAEGYHQDFMKRNPMHPYIVYWDAPKIAELERRFPEILARP